jgi:hypothetical protein
MEEDADGFTPLGRRLFEMYDGDGMNGVAGFLNKLLDAMGRTSWNAKNLCDGVKETLNKPIGDALVGDEIDALMKELREWEG